ncbi:MULTISPECIES: ABC transporter substrate-binding protein [Trichocoleus]|uniref:ABC transporter substrate-binding protein n=1 Tax=Trichocoleus desertorum GB2-A4 TaxID=2933944 RepID=A0ABV0J621_9CYAN|nr:ABC transporter substrate-binding protein [Trichocoleus sp. FACHB-46]MBD1863320.1 ABC transporter substrate-binding protein [Trichocoleus sp. FACHB-46]
MNFIWLSFECSYRKKSKVKRVADEIRHGAVSRIVQAQFAIALLLTLSSCQSPTQSSNGLKLGTLLPITGDLAQYGSPMQDSARLLVKTVNNCGGVLGQPVELISEDDQTEPAAGASAMTKLAEVDRVAGVVGGASSAVSSAAVDIAVRNQVTQISPASTSPVFTERAKNGDFQGFWFRTAPPDTFQGQALAKLAKDQGFQTVAILTINNDYGNGLVTSFIPAFEALGGKVVSGQPTRYPPDAATFESEVGAAFSSNPDAVLLIAYPETGSLILKSAYQQGLLNKKTKVLATDGLKDAAIANLVGKNQAGKFIANGLIGTAASAGGPAIVAFRQLYNAEYKRQPSVYDPNTWDATALMVLAAESAKAATGSALKDKIREVASAPGQEVTDICQALELVRQGKDVNYQGASGTLELDAQGDVVGSYDIWTIQENGELAVKGQLSVGGS